MGVIYANDENSKIDWYGPFKAILCLNYALLFTTDMSLSPLSPACLLCLMKH